MDLNWNGKLLLGVELLTQELGQHLVDPQVTQKSVVLLQELSFIFILFEVALQLVDPDHFGNAGDF